MSPKASRKTQPQAGGPEGQSQAAQALVGSSKVPPLSPAAPPQPPGGGASDLEPQPGSPAQPGVSGWVSQPQQGASSGAAPPSPSSSSSSSASASSSSASSSSSEPGPSEEPQPGTSASGALAVHTLGQLQDEASGPKPRFRAGDQVLCLHGSLLYEAKCVRVAEEACGAAAAEAGAGAGAVTYLIHYTGWNKNWDEWVPESRVFECSEANVARQGELLRAHRAQQPPRRGPRARKPPGLQQQRPAQGAPEGGEGGEGGEGSACAAPEPAGPPPRRKRGRGELSAEGRAEAGRIRPDVKVDIPEELKPWLVDDWDLVTKQKRLFGLPARKSVDSILEEYARARSAPGAAEEKAFAAVEVVAGIREYFNVMLGTQLLYKFERPQYAEVLARHPGASMSQIYGAPHLLRLFVRIGAMLAYTPLDDRSLALLLGHLHDFVAYLAQNCSALFSVHDYGAAPPGYHERAA